MAFKVEKGMYGSLICDRCENAIITGVTKDDIPHGEVVCHLCGPLRKKEITQRSRRAA